MGALEHLALDPTRFLSDVFGARPEVTATSQDYSWLGSLDAFDHLINDTLLPSAAFRMVRDGSPMPVETIFHETGLFVSGGSETTRTAIAHGLRAFCDHNDQWELLHEHPEHVS